MILSSQCNVEQRRYPVFDTTSQAKAIEGIHRSLVHRGTLLDINRVADTALRVVNEAGLEGSAPYDERYKDSAIYPIIDFAFAHREEVTRYGASLADYYGFHLAVERSVCTCKSLPYDIFSTTMDIIRYKRNLINLSPESLFENYVNNYWKYDLDTIIAVVKELRPNLKLTTAEVTVLVVANATNSLFNLRTQEPSNYFSALQTLPQTAVERVELTVQELRQSGILDEGMPLEVLLTFMRAGLTPMNVNNFKAKFLATPVGKDQ